MLLGLLHRDGFSVTQATLSRDLKALRVGKVAEGSEGYYYTLPTEEERRETEKNYLQDIQRGFVNMDYSGNLVVLHTLSGHADSVAIALDSLGLDEVIGTIAGDDTVLVVLREGVSAGQLLSSLQQRVPELEE
jgi:transcriptional regulator of arginine metabolism